MQEYGSRCRRAFSRVIKSVLQLLKELDGLRAEAVPGEGAE
jgi:hypothetical protein